MQPMRIDPSETSHCEYDYKGCDPHKGHYGWILSLFYTPGPEEMAGPQVGTSFVGGGLEC